MREPLNRIRLDRIGLSLCIVDVKYAVPCIPVRLLVAKIDGDQVTTAASIWPRDPIFTCVAMQTRGVSGRRMRREV